MMGTNATEDSADGDSWVLLSGAVEASVGMLPRLTTEDMEGT